MAASILRSETFEITAPEWANNPTSVADAVGRVIVPDFESRKDDEKATAESTTSVDDIGELVTKLKRCRVGLQQEFRMKAIQFEKDDDTNYHVDMIVVLANTRAWNNNIPEVDKLKAKLIAGRIVPAIATSTVIATGFVCLGLYKVLDGSHKVEVYITTYTNLAVPLFSIAEPVPPKVVKHQDLSWTLWDRWVIEGNPSVRKLLVWLKRKGVNGYSISCRRVLLFSVVLICHKERIDRKVVDLARKVDTVDMHRRHIDLVVACVEENDDEVYFPPVSLYTRAG